MFVHQKIKSTTCALKQRKSVTNNNIANKLLHRRNAVTLPTYECAESLANDFADYFIKTVIRITLQKPHFRAITLWAQIVLTLTGSCQVSCHSHETKETTQLLSKSPPNTYKLAPMPSKIVKLCHDSTYYEHHQ